jgi:hypothetical protein
VGKKERMLARRLLSDLMLRKCEQKILLLRTAASAAASSSAWLYSSENPTIDDGGKKVVDQVAPSLPSQSLKAYAFTIFIF